MGIVDIVILVIYLVVMLGIGFFFLKKNSGVDDYFVGGRDMSSLHVGLSVVATDVGGGFSIGLGGLGFSIGLSGAWMLFTGLIGAWIAAIFLIPRIKKLEETTQFITFPQIFNHFYGKRVAFIAAIITTVGYLGFTSSQLLAGAKLASATFDTLDMNTALIGMGILAVVYTSIGGIKAVIYTDTVQWIILMSGLIFIGIPVAHNAVGGFESLYKYLPSSHLSLSNISFQTVLNWAITIIPIWFIGMTLYQRIYACRDVKSAKKAWFIAGLLEFPIMAFMGVLLGLYARVALEMGMFESFGFAAGASLDSELGMPLLLKKVLPMGIMGVVLAAYFSAILSTADSCLMASSGSFVSDFINPKSEKNALKISQIATFSIGCVAIVLASSFENVLNLMLYSYSFMVSGLFIPLLGAIFFNKRNPNAAILSMVFGGGMTILFSLTPPFPIPFNLDANFVGIVFSLFLYIIVTIIDRPKGKI